MLELSHHNADLILEVSDFLGFEGQEFVEKDLFVTKAIEIISRIETAYFKPVFAGGTCLAKAHKIINRASEDVDFKIVQKEAAANLSKGALRRERKAFHNVITETLEKEGFTVDYDKFLLRNERKNGSLLQDTFLQQKDMSIK